MKIATVVVVGSEEEVKGFLNIVTQGIHAAREEEWKTRDITRCASYPKATRVDAHEGHAVFSIQWTDEET